MNSSKTVALISAVLLALFLWLRPRIGELGLPTVPDVHGRSATRTPESVGLPPSSLPELARPTSPPPTPPPIAGIAHIEAAESRILELVNQARTTEHLPPLKLDDTLVVTARGQSDDMLTRQFFDHVNPAGEAPADRIQRQHRRLIGITGENIWELSGFAPSKLTDLAGQIMRDWMNSPGHRENILRREFTHLGVGVSVTGMEIRATQNFAGIQGLLAQPLPATITHGAAVDLSTSGGRTPDRFDIWSKEKGLKIAGPSQIKSATLEAPRGVYVLRFYYLRSPGSFVIYEGPRIEIQ